MRQTDIGYVIDYESECSADILELTGEVKLKGQSYIDDLFNTQ